MILKAIVIVGHIMSTRYKFKCNDSKSQFSLEIWSKTQLFGIEAIKQWLLMHGGNIDLAAKNAGVSRRTVETWLLKNDFGRDDRHLCAEITELLESAAPTSRRRRKGVFREAVGMPKTGIEHAKEPPPGT
jgi:hypothetical protein